MWDDVVIGESKSERSHIAVHSTEFPSNISHNFEAYWIKGCILGFGMTIYKDTAEGRKIKAFLSKEDHEKLQEYLDLLILKRATPEKLKDRITNFGNQKYQDGKRAKMNEIRAALGI
jgi:hypothetical protein